MWNVDQFVSTGFSRNDLQQLIKQGGRLSVYLPLFDSCCIPPAVWIVWLLLLAFIVFTESTVWMVSAKPMCLGKMTIVSLHYLGNFLRCMNPEMSVELDDTLPSTPSVLAAVVLSYTGFGSGRVSHFHFSPVTHFLLQIFEFYLMYTCSLTMLDLDWRIGG